MTEVFAYILGVLTSWLAWRFKERDRRIKDVADAYIQIAPPRAYADGLRRLRAFQQCGIALLKTEKEAEEARKLIIHRGYRDPLKEWDFVEKLGVVRFFAEANLRDIVLSDMDAVVKLCMTSENDQQKDDGDDRQKIV